ncbi:MAG: hypothetical protein LCH62_15855 [Proteobacteria bacterium]|nr:hypothetical protein [Pseudomonadota bacterium]
MSQTERLPAWFVVFQDANRIFVHRWLKPGFRHCWAFAWDEPAGRWLVFEPLFDGMFLRTVDGDLMGATIAQPGNTIVLAQCEYAVATRPALLATCVSAMQALLGLRSRRALTPYGLYRTLLASGAVVVREA